MKVKRKYIYIVMGETGEYDDHQEWHVGAHTSKRKAEKHRDLAQLRANEYANERDSTFICTVGVNQYDTHMKMDYNGTKYCVAEVEIISKLPKPKKKT